MSTGQIHRRRLCVFGLIATFYLAIPNARPDFSRFDTHDSENYLALSYSLVHGLGYTRNMIPGQYIAHKWWPPGMPVLMAPALILSGNTINWLAAKWTVALIGLAGIVLSWLLVRRLTASNRTADVAALALGLNTIYWDFSHQVMAEVPVTVWIIAGALVVDKLWARRHVRIREAFLAGFFCGLGMLIKAHAIALLLAPLAYVWGPRRTSAARPALARSCLIFCLGFTLPNGLWMARNQTIVGSGFDGLTQVRGIRSKAPMDPGAETLTLRDTVRIAVHTARSSAIYHLPRQIIPGPWPDRLLDWKGSGWVALLVTLALVVLCFVNAECVNVLHMALLPTGLLSLSFIAGGLARYWVPLSVLMTILIGIAVGQVLARSSSAARFRLSDILGIVLCGNLIWYVARFEREPYNSGPWKELATLFETAARSPITSTGVLTPNFFAFQLMTGIPAPMLVEDRKPYYQHMVARLDGASPKAPPQARPILTVYPWALYVLPRPMSLPELVTKTDLAWGSIKVGGRRLSGAACPETSISQGSSGPGCLGTQ